MSSENPISQIHNTQLERYIQCNIIPEYFRVHTAGQAKSQTINSVITIVWDSIVLQVQQTVRTLLCVIYTSNIVIMLFAKNV